MVIVLTAAIHLLIPASMAATIARLPQPAAILCVATFIIAFVPVFLLRPYRYDLEPEELIIRKMLLPRKIRVTEILSAEPVTYNELKITLRLWASGGLWGWFGIFQSSRYGRITLQCTEQNNLVLLSLQDGRKVVLSPRDRDLFLQTLNKNPENKAY